MGENKVTEKTKQIILMCVSNHFFPYFLFEIPFDFQMKDHSFFLSLASFAVNGGSKKELIEDKKIVYKFYKTLIL